MRLRLTIYSALAVIFPGTGLLAESNLVLAERGRPACYSILLPEDASASARYAAEELRDHICGMTSVLLPIVPQTEGPAIRIIQTDDGQNGVDGFRIRADGQNVVVSGGCRGVLYGVYELLESFGGCKWFSSETIIIPKQDAFRIPASLDRKEEAAFPVREVLWFDAGRSDFAARVRLNGPYHRLGVRHGGDEFRYGKGLGPCHTFDKLLPVGKHFDLHPEYFSEVDGGRVREHTQLCLTNPDVLRLVTDAVLSAIAKDPTARYFGVSQNDWMGYCTCERCRAVDEEEGSHAGSVIRFVNAIADEVAKCYPEKVVQTLAYQYSRKPPRKVRPRPNVMVCLCSYECDFANPLKTSWYEENRRFCDEITAWAGLTKNLMVWDYTTNYRHYLQPFPNLGVFRENLRLFRKCGAAHVLEQGAYSGPHADFAELKAWLLAKLLWNPEQSFEVLLEDFLAGYYGAAAPFVKRYLEELASLQKQRSGVGGLPLLLFEDIGASVCDNAFLERAIDLWRQAERAVREDSLRLKNVRMSALSTMFMVFSRQARNVWVTRTPERFVIPGMNRRKLAHWLRDRFGDSRYPIVVSEAQGVTKRFLEKIKSMSESEQIIGAADCAQVKPIDYRFESDLLKDDGFIEGGKAFVPSSDEWDWQQVLKMDDVAFDDVEYDVSIQVKIERRAGGKDNEAFWAGVYDYANRKECANVSRRASDCVDGWAWYDIGRLRLSETQRIWVAPGRFDRKEFTFNPAIREVRFGNVKIARANNRKENK